MKKLIIDNANFEIVKGVWIDKLNTWCDNIGDNDIIISFCKFMDDDGNFLDLSKFKYCEIWNNRLECYNGVGLNDECYYLVKWYDDWQIKEFHKSILGLTLWLNRKYK